MAKNQRYPEAKHISVPAPYDVESGQPVVLGAIRGVAFVTASEGDPVTVWLDGSWDLNVAGAVNVGDTVGATDADTPLTVGGDFGVALTSTAGAGIAEIAPFGFIPAAGGGSGE